MQLALRLCCKMSRTVMLCRGFIKGRTPGKLTGCEHDFARLLYISKNFFLIQGTIKNSLSYNRALFLISLIEYKTYFAVQFPLYYTRHVVRYVLKTRIAP